MSTNDLPQPPTTQDGKTDPRWMYLLWNWIRSNLPGSQNSVIVPQIFGQHLTQPMQPNQIAGDSQVQLANSVFHHNQGEKQVNQIAVDSSNILANQIFGS